jgi:hypothetical protein
MLAEDFQADHGGSPSRSGVGGPWTRLRPHRGLGDSGAGFHRPCRPGLTYQAAGMPGFVTTARNTWTVIALDAGTCRVSLAAQFDTRGLLGAIARRLLLVQAFASRRPKPGPAFCAMPGRRA